MNQESKTSENPNQQNTLILNHKRHWLILLLSVTLLFSLWRLAGWVVRFAGESL